MNLIKICLAIMVIFLFVASILIFAKRRPVENKAIPNNPQPAAESQVNSEGSVTVEARPIALSKTADIWQFEVVLETHIVELSQDMTKVTVLRDGKGTEYLPLDWNGSPPGGHHREGILTFKTPPSPPPSITLIVKNIDGIPERKFEWKL
jgi:biopolymer transport protein ExbD